MVTDTPDAEGNVSRRLALIKQVDAGLFECMDCPSCKQPTVSAWFTHPAESEYRTWFRCANCPFEMRAHNTGQPAAYRVSRRKFHRGRQRLTEGRMPRFARRSKRVARTR